mgnify:CR=1 FL=1
MDVSFVGQKPEAVGGGSLCKQFKVTNLIGETFLLEMDTFTIAAISCREAAKLFGLFLLH